MIHRFSQSQRRPLLGGRAPATLHSVLNVKVRVGAINQEKALVVLGAFSVTVKTDGLFAALLARERETVET